MPLNDSLGSAGVGHTCTLGDKDYTFMPITKRMQATYSEWLKKRVRKANRDSSTEMREEARELRKQVIAEKETLSEDEVKQLSMRAFRLEQDAASHAKDLDASIAAGDYEFASDISIDSMGTVGGMTMLAHLTLLPKQPKITLDDCESLVKDHYNEVSKAIRIANGMIEENPPKEEPKKDSAASPNPSSNQNTSTELPVS